MFSSATKEVTERRTKQTREICSVCRGLLSLFFSSELYKRLLIKISNYSPIEKLPVLQKKVNDTFYSV